jgi:CBS domain-containing protein
VDTSKLTAAREALQDQGQQARQAIAERVPEVKEKLVEAGGRARDALSTAAEQGRESTADLRLRLAEALADVELPERRRTDMVGKLFSKFTAGLAIGYVLGTRAGRERYEQIKGWLGAAAENPKVQQFTEQAKDLVEEKTGLGGGGSETGTAPARLPQNIREVMTAAPETVGTGASLTEAAKLMRDIDAGAMVVVNEQGNVAGIVTDRDIAVRAVAEGQDPNQTKVGQVLSADLVTLSPTDTVAQAVKLMRDKAVRRLPVVEAGKPIGIVSIGDLAVERDPTSALAHISTAPSPKK